MTAALSRLRSRAGLTLTLTTLVVASGGATLLPAGASAATHRSRHHVTHKRHSTHHSCVPQNGGDRDSDNHGGPSDGDGCT